MKKLLVIFGMCFSATVFFAYTQPVYANFSCGDSVSYEGEQYPTVLIGAQCWFAKNLNVGERLDLKKGQSGAEKGTIQKYCNSDDEKNCSEYGGLYQWHTVMGLSDSCANSKNSGECATADVEQGICPSGWHIPSQSEVELLVGQAKGGGVAGGQLKEKGNIHWKSPNNAAVDSLGFSALGTGYAHKGKMKGFQTSTFFWTSTHTQNKRATSLYLFSKGATAALRGNDKAIGASVRCVMDEAVVVDEAKYTLDYVAGSNGSLSGLAHQLVEAGGDGVDIEAVPFGGFVFEKWSDGLIDNPRTDLAVSSDITVTASFVASMAPTAPGNLEPAFADEDSVWLKVGTSSADDNFVEYKIYYDVGDAEVDESDLVADVTDIPVLDQADFGGENLIQLKNLFPGTEYSVNIYAYDADGNKSKAEKKKVKTAHKNSVKTIKEYVKEMVNDPTVTDVVNGYGTAVESTSRMTFEKETIILKADPVTDDSSVNIPANTTMTALDVMGNEVTADFGLLALDTNTDLSDFPGAAQGAMSFGISGKKISISQPIMLTLATPNAPNGSTLDVYTKEAGEPDWVRHQLDGVDVSCLVMDGVCVFSTTHLSDFGGEGGGEGVPEFSTIVYLLMLAMFGYFIHRKMPEIQGGGLAT